jgi:hypothetical protein
VVRAELRSLSAAGLLTFATESLEVSREPTSSASELLEELAAKRSPTRPIPVPRRILRLLARPGRASTAVVILAYVLRGLTLDRRTGEVRGRGSVKASWIAEAYGLSMRSVRAARADMVRLGLIGRDRASSQWKLNRTGAYFSWNLAWSGASRVAPRRAAPASHPAPLIERPETPNGSRRDQKPAGSGVLRKPDIRSVREEDLRRLDTLDELYRQAVRARILDGTESEVLNFVGAAVRAITSEVRAPERVFMGIVRRRLWGHVTQAQEARARAGLTRFRSSRPEAFRISSRPSERAPTWTWPKEPPMSREEIRVAAARSLGLAA